MELDDWCICPNSKMPALYSAYVRFIEQSHEDPVCGKPVAVGDLVKLTEEQAKEQIELYNSTQQQEEDNKENSPTKSTAAGGKSAQAVGRDFMSARADFQ